MEIVLIFIKVSVFYLLNKEYYKLKPPSVQQYKDFYHKTAAKRCNEVFPAIGLCGKVVEHLFTDTDHGGEHHWRPVPSEDNHREGGKDKASHKVKPLVLPNLVEQFYEFVPKISHRLFDYEVIVC